MSKVTPGVVIMMSESEKKAYNWLKKQGYKNIVFYSNRTPDFYADGDWFEIKLAYPMKTGELKILLYPGQREEIMKKGAHILVFTRSGEEPVDIIKPNELDNKKVRNIILHDVEEGKAHISITIDKAIFKEIDRRRGNLSRSAYIEAILRKHFGIDYPLRL